jgi:CheY-like chemotaxis protein
VVEDNGDTLFIFAKLLRMSGYTVHTADGYQAALDVAKREKIDVAICDIALWDGDGCDLLQELQKLQPLKAIAVTGFTLADEVENYRNAGFAAVFPKPVDPSQIVAAIAQLTSSGTIEPATDLKPLKEPTEELDHKGNDFSSQKPIV